MNDLISMFVGSAFMLSVVLAAFSLYFLPAIVAQARGHRQNNAITIVNLFLGWTLLGWVLSLAWACMDEKA